jgi:two-component system, OmpR family, sensor histidine kinase KdpD
MDRGTLRVYLGFAPGVGKTFRMLEEGGRRRDRGTDVVVGFVETHGRARTAEQIKDLEVVPRRKLVYQGKTFDEMDVAAVLTRAPRVALVDELAHSNVPGSIHDKRWRDVELLLSAGINVITTLNIQHLESLNDVVERITGVRQREKIPDAVVRRAEQIEIVDMSPWALRRRMVHGNIYRREKVEAALSHYFRVGNLTALRELALLWLADQVDDSIDDYEIRHGLEGADNAERIVVALAGRPEDERLILRAARIALRLKGELVAVHVASALRESEDSNRGLDLNRSMVRELEGRFHEIVGDDVATSLVQFAQAEHATQLVIGGSRRSRWADIRGGSVVGEVIRSAGSIDVHVISLHDSPHMRAGFRPRMPALTTRRLAAGVILAAAGPALLTLVLQRLPGLFELPAILLAFMALVIVIAGVGGWAPAMVAAVASFGLVNWYFTPPLHRFVVADAGHLASLAMFLVVATAVSAVVANAGRNKAEGGKAREEAEAMVQLAGMMLDPDCPIDVLLDRVRSLLGLKAAAVLRLDAGEWLVEAAAGDPPLVNPAGADESFELHGGRVLAVDGTQPTPSDRRVLTAFVNHLDLMVRDRELKLISETSATSAEMSEVRGALLAAVSHHLKTPLSSIKACVSSLRQSDVHWPPDQTKEFLRTIVEATGQLEALIANLMDMSRLHAGVVGPHFEDVYLEGVVDEAINALGAPGRIHMDVPDSLEAWADPALLIRALENLIRNALAWSPENSPVLVGAGRLDGQIQVRVADRGPGIPAERRETVFDAFQHSDQSTHRGAGLGLAVARGFVEAMGGRLEPSHTRGGGLTMVITLPGQFLTHSAQ